MPADLKCGYDSEGRVKEFPAKEALPSGWADKPPPGKHPNERPKATDAILGQTHAPTPEPVAPTPTPEPVKVHVHDDDDGPRLDEKPQGRPAKEVKWSKQDKE